jgi:hypothetical protein
MEHLLSVQAYWTLLLVVHGLLAVALLGALTHQAAAVLSQQPRTPQAGFVARFSTVPAQRYARAVCWLWVLCFVFGGWIYSEYRVSVRIPMEQQELFKTLGAFELKEHLAVIGLGMLPAYRWFWLNDHAELHAARRWVTVVLALMAWYTFLAGHVVNNARGFGA